MNLRPVQIIDLDGCISDDRHRRSLIKMNSHPNPFEWFRAYHEAGESDPAENTEQVMRLNNTRIVVITSRPTTYDAPTRRWLARHNIYPYAMLMRNNFDYRHSVEVKRSAVYWLLDNYDVDRHDVIDAIDDRLDVVLMYGGFGFPSRLVQIEGEGG